MTQNNSFFDYLASVGGNCPLLPPTIRAKGVFCRTTDVLTADPMDDIAQICLDAQHEILSYFAARAVQKRTDLLSVNIIIRFPTTTLEDELGEAYASIGHEILRDMFLPHNILCGKFWRGEIITTNSGVNISPSPVTFISMRPLILPNDEKFIPSNLMASLGSARESMHSENGRLPECSREHYKNRAISLFIAARSEMEKKLH